MSTNPNNAVGTNAAYGGRTSVNAFNDDLAAYTSGIMSGWGCVPNSGMTVSLGGDGNTRDVAVAEDNAGNKTTINNISGSPINVTLGAAPGSNSRIDVIVAYVDNPPQGSSSVADNPAACGIIAVQGTPANTPVVPNDGTIRTAITADGASGTTAYYVILAQITVTSGTTDITSGDIESGSLANVHINPNTIGQSQLDFSTLNFSNYSTTEIDTKFTWIDGKTIYKKTISFGALPNNSVKVVAHGISNIGTVIKTDWWAFGTNQNYYMTEYHGLSLWVDSTNVEIECTSDRSMYTQTYITVYYTKTS